jgi:hypothetical protein
LQYKIIGAPKKFKKWSRPLFKPKTNHSCHQKPNSSRETIPLNERMSPTRNFAASPPSVPDLPPSPRSPRPPEVQEENHQGAQTGTSNLTAQN